MDRKRRKCEAMNVKKLICLGLAAALACQSMPAMAASLQETAEVSIQEKEIQTAASSAKSNEFYSFEIEGTVLVRCKDTGPSGTLRADHVDIPEGVTSIAGGAFEHCSYLASVTIPEGVVSIEEDAFKGCYWLWDVTVPESVTSIGKNAFNKRLTVVCPEIILTVKKGSYAEHYANYEAHWPMHYYYEGNDELQHPMSEFEKENLWAKQPASLGSDGIGVYRCGLQNHVGDVIKEVVIYAPKTIKLAKESYVYNGKNHKPSVTVKDRKGNVLSPESDYTVSYPKAAKNVGSYTVTVNFKGKYEGPVNKTFSILPKNVSIARLQAKKKGFSVKWKKQTVQTAGYEVAYSTSAKFPKKNTKIATVKRNKTVSTNVSKCKAGKRYYVRIRAYQTVKGKKYVSGWSKAKSVVAKK